MVVDESETKNLGEMTREQLVEQAEAIGVSVRRDMSKAALREAIVSALAERQNPPVSGPGVPAADDGGEPLTVEQRAKLATASVETIEQALADPALPALWRSAFRAEAERRRARTAADAMKSEIERWLVVKGGRYCLPGYQTTLPEGSVISALTHNLDDVRKQGIGLRRLEGEVVVVMDQLGFARTRIVPVAKP